MVVLYDLNGADNGGLSSEVGRNCVSPAILTGSDVFICKSLQLMQLHLQYAELKERVIDFQSQTGLCSFNQGMPRIIGLLLLRFVT